MYSRGKKSEREIARITGLSRNTIAKWLHGPLAVEPKYRRGEHARTRTFAGHERGAGAEFRLLTPTNGMDAPTRNGIAVPKWKR